MSARLLPRKVRHQANVRDFLGNWVWPCTRKNQAEVDRSVCNGRLKQQGCKTRRMHEKLGVRIFVCTFLSRCAHGVPVPALQRPCESEEACSQHARKILMPGSRHPREFGQAPSQPVRGISMPASRRQCEFEQALFQHARGIPTTPSRHPREFRSRLRSRFSAIYRDPLFWVGGRILLV